MRESELLRLVMDWFRANQIMAFRMNTGAVKLEKRFVRFGVPGMADILAFVTTHTGEKTYDGKEEITYSEPLWVELKVGRNGQSDLQKSFQRQVEREGHKYIICYSLDCVEAHFR